MVNLTTGLSGRLEDLSSMPKTQGGARGGATSRRAFRTPRSVIRARECFSNGSTPGVEAHVQVSERAGGLGQAPGLRSRGGEGARVGTARPRSSESLLEAQLADPNPGAPVSLTLLSALTPSPLNSWHRFWCVTFIFCHSGSFSALTRHYFLSF